jgi:two pore calcium channel protein 2
VVPDSFLNICFQVHCLCRLEFVTAVTCVAVALDVYLPMISSFSESRWIRFAAFLRLINLLQFLSALQLPSMLRFLYVIFSVRPIEVFYETFVSMIPSVLRLFKFMFCLVFVFGALGVTFFGGLVNKNPNDPNFEKLSDMAYGQSDYWGMNFNDMASAMVVLVQILVVNNWMVFVEAYGEVGHAGAWIMFILFHFLGVIAGATA